MRACAYVCVSLYESPCRSTRPPSRRTASTLMAGVVTGMHTVAAHPCAMPTPLKPSSAGESFSRTRPGSCRKIALGCVKRSVRLPRRRMVSALRQARHRHAIRVVRLCAVSACTSHFHCLRDVSGGRPATVLQLFQLAASWRLTNAKKAAGSPNGP